MEASSNRSPLATALRDLARDPAVLDELRAAIRQLCRSEHPSTRTAGKCWSAGFGALIVGVEAQDAVVLGKSVRLMVLGLDAWLDALGDQLNGVSAAAFADPATFGVAERLGAVCGSVRDLFAGDATAGRRLDRSVQGLKRSLRKAELDLEARP